MLPSFESPPAAAEITSPETVPAGAMVKVFVKCDDGHWRIASSHCSRREAEWTADLLVARDGVVARVML